MLRHALLICSLLTVLSRVGAQGELTKAGVPVEVVATASEYVPTTVSHPGHSYTNCHGNTYFFAQFNSYGDSGTLSGTATTTTNCNTSFTPPTEDTTFQRVNYTIAKGEKTLYLLSCTQARVPTVYSQIARRGQAASGALSGLSGSGADGSAADRSREQEGKKWSVCPAFTIGTKYVLAVKNISDARLVDTAGGKVRKSDKVEFLSSANLPESTSQPAPPPLAQVVSTTEMAKVHFTSSPSGGEIYVDGKFVGNTPSDITIAAGEHIVKVTSGGKDWARTIQITSGEISVHAELPEDK
jgi:hypothetical protein